jgi:diaminopimelate decarboxylase
MASNYNARRRAAEVLVDGDRYAVVTRRESYEDLMRLDVDAPEWKDAEAWTSDVRRRASRRTKG